VASYFAPAPPAAARGGDVKPPEEDLPVSGPGLDRAAKRDGRAASPAVVHKSGAPGSTATAPAAAAARPGTPSASAPPPAAPAPAEPATATPVAPAPYPTGVDVVVAEKDGRVLAPAPSPVRTPPRLPTGRVFTNGDPKVIPAVLLRPHLPDQPPAGVPEEQVGTLEFVVTETGAVEHVHLVSPANRYQERMLVAAAKTWQFQPATRDGHPVRFRTRIRVTL
jgi:TonB family protein